MSRESPIIREKLLTLCHTACFLDKMSLSPYHDGNNVLSPYALANVSADPAYSLLHAKFLFSSKYTQSRTKSTWDKKMREGVNFHIDCPKLRRGIDDWSLSFT